MTEVTKGKKAAQQIKTFLQKKQISNLPILWLHKVNK